MDSHSLNHLLLEIDALHRDCRLDLRHRELFTRKMETFWPALADEIRLSAQDAARYRLRRSIDQVDMRLFRWLLETRPMRSALDHHMDRVLEARCHGTLTLPLWRGLGLVLLTVPLEGCRPMTRAALLVMALL